MEEKKDYKEMRNGMRERMKLLAERKTEIDPDLELWIGEFNDEFAKASQKMLNKIPKAYTEVGTVEAYLVGLAQFTCRVVTRWQNRGIFSVEVDGMKFYTEVLLPICNDVAKADWEAEEEAENISKDLEDVDIPIDDILQKYFADKKQDWDVLRKEFEELREIVKKGD